MAGRVGVFVSYRRVDSDPARSLSRELDHRQFDVFRDVDGIAPGTAFADEIRRHLESSRVSLR